MFRKQHKLVDGELLIPDQARAAKEKVELVRVWVADGKVYTALRPDALPPSGFGIMLVDVARHVANAVTLMANNGDDWVAIETCLSQIKAGFDAEWNNQTSDVGGELVD